MLKRLATIAGLAVLTVALASAQNFSPEMNQAIQGFKLDTAKANAIIKTQAQLSELVLNEPARMKQLAASMKLPAEERIAQMEKDPASAAILKSNGLTSKDYFTGLMALRAAAWAVEGKAGSLSNLSSPANVSFLKANPSILRQFNENEGGGMMRKPR